MTDLATPPGLGRGPELAEFTEGGAPEPECLLMDEVLIRLVVLVLLGGA